MSIDVLLQEARGMTDDTLREVIHYMQFLKVAPSRTIEVSVTPIEENKEIVYRQPGLYKNQIKMSDDFDNPLDDFEEYMYCYFWLPILFYGLSARIMLCQPGSLRKSKELKTSLSALRFSGKWPLKTARVCWSFRRQYPPSWKAVLG